MRYFIKGTELTKTEGEDISVYGYKELSEEKYFASFALVSEIERLKCELFATDYQAIKFAEGETPAEEYAPIKAKRAEWRAKINELEAKL